MSAHARRASKGQNRRGCSAIRGHVGRHLRGSATGREAWRWPVVLGSIGVNHNALFWGCLAMSFPRVRFVSLAVVAISLLSSTGSHAQTTRRTPPRRTTRSQPPRVAVKPSRPLPGLSARDIWGTGGSGIRIPARPMPNRGRQPSRGPVGPPKLPGQPYPPLGQQMQGPCIPSTPISPVFSTQGGRHVGAGFGINLGLTHNDGR